METATSATARRLHLSHLSQSIYTAVRIEASTAVEKLAKQHGGARKANTIITLRAADYCTAVGL